jgi:hypothetical protein
MPKVKSYLNPNIPRPTPSPSGGEAARYKTQPVKPPVRKPKPKPGKGDGRKTIMPVPPKGKKPSKRNDIIRNQRRPEGTK